MLRVHRKEERECDKRHVYGGSPGLEPLSSCVVDCMPNNFFQWFFYP